MISEAYEYGVKLALSTYHSPTWFLEPTTSPDDRPSSIERAFNTNAALGDNTDFSVPAAVNPTLDPQTLPGSDFVRSESAEDDHGTKESQVAQQQLPAPPKLGTKPTQTPVSTVPPVTPTNPMAILSANAASANAANAQNHGVKFVSSAVPQMAKAGAYVVPPEKRKKDEIEADNGSVTFRKDEDRMGVVSGAFNTLNSEKPTDHINSGGAALFGTPGF